MVLLLTDVIDTHVAQRRQQSMLLKGSVQQGLMVFLAVEYLFPASSDVIPFDGEGQSQSFEALRSVSRNSVTSPLHMRVIVLHTCTGYM